MLSNEPGRRYIFDYDSIGELWTIIVIDENIGLLLLSFYIAHYKIYTRNNAFIAYDPDRRAKGFISNPHYGSFIGIF